MARKMNDVDSETVLGVARVALPGKLVGFTFFLLRGFCNSRTEVGCSKP